MKKLQKIIFFLGAISLVVFGNKDAISTIASKEEAAAPQVEVITSTLFIFSLNLLSNIM